MGIYSKPLSEITRYLLLHFKKQRVAHVQNENNFFLSGCHRSPVHLLAVSLENDQVSFGEHK